MTEQETTPTISALAESAASEALRLIKVVYDDRMGCAGFRMQHGDALPVGAAQPFALELAEAALVREVEKAFDGVKSNAEQRAAFLTSLKSTSNEYLEAKEDCARARLHMEELDATLERDRSLHRVHMATLAALTAIIANPGT